MSPKWDVMSKSIFSKIFSLEDYGVTHKILHILGIKIKFPQKEYIQKQKENPFEKYKRNNVDITTLPPATGQIRDIQLANLEMLKELDYVCKQQNLKYWLDYGTLLGAVRHKGFIPWDDDIDTGMMRDDYEKLYEVFDKTTRNPNISVKIYSDIKNNTLMKVYYKKCDYIFADIFPYDYTPDLKTNEQIRLSKKLKNFNRKNIVSMESFEDFEQKVKEITSEIYSGNGETVAYGIDYGHTIKNWFFSKEITFPLKELEFEGNMYPVFKNCDAFLTRLYGDYMAYPTKFGMGHTMYLDLSEEDKKHIAELIN